MTTIFNATDGPLPVDGDGRVVGAHRHRGDVDATDSVLAGHIAAGRVIVTAEDVEPVEDGEPVEVVARTTKPTKPKATPAPEED